jgi:hypothetical protein
MATGRRWRLHATGETGVLGMSVMRAVLLVVGVVLGAIIIANVSPGGTPVPAAHHNTGKASPPIVVSPSAKPQPLVCGSPSGVRVAVENATSVAGRAAATAKRVQDAGYTINAQTDIGNAPTQSSTTTVYFQSAGNKHEALCLKKRLFHIATVAALPSGSGLSPLVQVAVYLGSDYAAAHPVG